MSERVQTQKVKITTKNGFVKTYTYVRPSKLKEKTKLFDILNTNQDVKNILKDYSLKPMEKIEKIRTLTLKIDDLNKLTTQQIKNFVYRNC